MSKKEFLEKLAMALAGQVPDSVVEENISYYETYISDEMAKGASLDEVLGSLGDPRLIGRSIIEANGGGSDMAGVYEDSDSGRTGYNPGQEPNGTEGGYQDYQEKPDPGFKSFHFNGFWALLIFILLFVLVIWVVGGIFTLLSPIMVPLLIILLIYWIFKGPRRY